MLFFNLGRRKIHSIEWTYKHWRSSSTVNVCVHINTSCSISLFTYMLHVSKSEKLKASRKINRKWDKSIIVINQIFFSDQCLNDIGSIPISQGDRLCFGREPANESLMSTWTREPMRLLQTLSWKTIWRTTTENDERMGYESQKDIGYIFFS